jgi:hypothetical protein
MTEPTKASVIATFSEAKKYGIARGMPTFRMMSRLDAPSARSTSSSLGLDGGEAGGDVHDDREERDQERG